MTPMTGYNHPAYAESLSEFGAPRELRRSLGWILVRDIPGVACFDGMGCYPLFACTNWSQLHLDLDDLGSDLVCLSLVADPFGEYDEAYLHRCFADVCFAFKEHFVTDLHRSAGAIVSTHHRYYAQKALKEVAVEVVADPRQFIEEWDRLYANLVQRFHLQGIKAFSTGSFVGQLAVPGLVAFRALSAGETVAAHLWYVRGEVAYSHLAASSARGYDLSAAYALYWHALGFFAGKVRWLDLGSGAGSSQEAGRGLTFFKRGWATGTRPAYFCGRIFDKARYAAILKAKDVTAEGYFPAYRRGEFG